MSNDRILPIKTSAGAITFSLLVEGNEVPKTFEFLSLTTHKEVNRVPMAKVVLRDGDAAAQDFKVSDTDTLVPGKKVEIKAGYDSKDETIFKGIIIKHGIKIREHGISVLEIVCKDEAVKMTVGRKNKYFSEVKDSDVIEEIIGTYGFKKTISSTPVTHKELVQFYCTDWDFVLSRAEMNGQLVIVDDGEIKVEPPKFSGNATYTLVHGATMYEFEAEMDARHQYQEITSSSWDHANQNILEQTGASPTANPQGNLSESDLAQVIGLSNFELRHSGQIVGDELKAWADATYIKNHLAKIVGRVKIRGFSKVKISDLIEFQGVGNRFNGNAYVTGVRQELTDGKWYTHIQFGKQPDWFYQEHEVTERPAAGLLPGINGLQIGIVTKLEGDPDGEERIQVRLPIVDPQAEGIWMRLASLDAGDDRGYVFRPEIDDEVIVGFINDDPRDPVVLGMLHSSAKPAPIPASDDNHEKGLLTRSKMKLHFDDDKKILTILTPAEKKIVLDEDAGNITIEDEIGNKMVMDSSGITMESAKDIIMKATGDVKVEGINIQHKASANFKAEGSAGANLESSAIAVVKGSLVQIN